MAPYTSDTPFNQIASLKKGEYENCVFTNCSFAEADFSGFVFIDCVFTSCNLSLIQLNNTALRGVRFLACKMLGVHFETTNVFGLSLSFDDCHLNHSSFHKLRLKKTKFIIKNLNWQKNCLM